MKRFIALALSSILFLGSLTTTVQTVQAENGFASNHWASEYLENLYNYGVMRGDLFGNFNPDKYITRAECISMINRALGYNEFQRGKLPFNDIKGTEWYADDIAIAYERGYFSGTSKNTAGAESNLTREQAASLICRNIKLEEKIGEVMNFIDSRSFSNWSKGAIGAGAEKGFINGYSDGSFKPFNYITRGEFAKMLSDVIGTLISDNSYYAYGYLDGNVTISSSGCTLANTIINGDLYITAGVGTGFVNIENVTVMGEVIISGGGESNKSQNSINFKNCSINKLIVDGDTDKVVSVDAIGATRIQTTIVKTDAYFEDFEDRNQGFINIEVSGEPETMLTLSGDFNNVSLMKPENYLTLGKGSIYNLVVDEDASESQIILDRNAYVINASLEAPCLVSGEGDIGSVSITSFGVEVTMLPDEIVIRPGITATINGETMTSVDAEESSANPRIIAGYPMEEELGPTNATFIYETNKPGRVYWVVTLEDENDLDEDEIIKPTNIKSVITSGSFDVKSSNTDVLSKITGLKAATDYVVSAVLQDERGNISYIKSEEFTTVDNTIPEFLSGYPKASSRDSTTMDITVNMSKQCTVYWAIFPKGSTAPTADELKKDKLEGEIDSGKEKRCYKNQEKVFTATGLKEETYYDVYLLATDGTNDSKLTKITAATKDTTPPEFISGYPKQYKMTDKTVDVNVKVNEDCTVYYVVCKKGAVFPAPIPPSTTPPSLDSQEGIEAIVTGNNTEINGKGSVKENTETTIKISKLEPETTYDLYMVAQDKSGNNSKGVKLTIKTTDIVPPTATQEFSADVNGEPKVESDITILFSEEVLNRNTMKSLENSTLNDNIVLYHIVDNEEFIVDIDYTKAEIGINDEGKTYIKFPAGTIDLNSGEKYQFELNYIVDTSNNRMKDGTRLDMFKTLSPQVQLSRTESPQNLDMTFSLDPQAIQTSDTTLFDMIFESDTTVEFELYEKNEAGKFKEIEGYNPLIYENGAMTLHYILDRKVNNQEDYTFEPFNKLEPREYGIRFTNVDGNAERESWNKTIKFNIKCVIGSKTVLSALAGNPKDGFNAAIEAGASQVNSPLKFEMSVSFTDTVIPYFIKPDYPKLEAQGDVASEYGQIGDTLIRPLVMTNKKCDLYYLVAPKNTVKDPTPLQIMTGALKPNGGVWGKYTVDSGHVEYPVLIEGLTPETEYDVFFVLKGIPPEPSDIWQKTFKTLKVAPPVLSLQVTNRAESSASVKITSDKNATIDWILLPSNNCKDWFTTDSEGNTILKISEETVAQIIRNGSENEFYRPVGFGTVKTKYNSTDVKYTADVTVSGLERDIYYTFFAIAKATLDSGQTNVGGDSKIVFEQDITPADVTPPEADAKTVITNYAPSQNGNPYHGQLLITFTEEVYYLPGENQEMKPLDAQFFAQNMEVIGSEIDEKDVKLKTYTTTASEYSNTRALKSITLTFKNAHHGATIYFPYEICDRNGNVAGAMELKFVDMESGGTGRRDSRWEISFVTK